MSTPLGCNYCNLLGPVWRDPESNSPGTAGSNTVMERAKKWELSETSSVFILLTSVFTLLENRYFHATNQIDKEIENLFQFSVWPNLNIISVAFIYIAEGAI